MTGKKMIRIGVALLIVAAVASAVAVRAADSPDMLAKRKLQRKAEQLRATERNRNEFDRAWLRSHTIDGRNSSQSLNFDTPIIRESSPPRDGYAVSGSMAAPAPSPGLDIAFTSYDYQANSSQGYQVARTPTGQEIHFTWMSFNIIPVDIEQSDRYVKYTNLDKTTMFMNQGYDGVPVTGADNRAGYCNIDVINGGQAQVGMHMAEDYNTPGLDVYGTWHVAFPAPPLSVQLAVQLVGYDLTCAEVLWPKLTADRSSDVVHEIAHSNVNDCPNDKLWYWRYNPGTQLWEGPGWIDNSPEISYALAVDANSAKVAVAVHAVAGGKNNVYYIESTADGSDWLTSTAPKPKTAITNYTDPNGFDAYVHLTATYDNSSALHVMWDEQENSASEHIAIKHWNSTRNTIRTAAIGYWDRPVTSGVFNLNLSKMTMGIGDGSTMCQGGAQSNSNYVYVVYTQFGGDTPLELSDYSSEYSFEGRSGGYMNGELYLSVSNSGGNTWSPKVNLTNTKTPGCQPGLASLTAPYLPTNPDSVCRSEHWSTIGRVVRDIDILFISDLDAGGIPQGEGSWQLNPVHYLQLPGGTTDAQYVCPVIAPVFASTLTSAADCEYHAPQAGSATATLTIFNLGNATLNQGTGGGLTVTDFPGLPQLSVPGPGPYSILAGDPDVVKTVTMTANGAAEGLYVGSISISHNDATSVPPSPRIYPILFFVFNQFFCPEKEVLKTGVASPGSLALQVESSGRFGSTNGEGGLWRYKDSSSTIYDASLLIAHGTQGSPDTTVFLRFFDRASNGQAGFRAQGDLVVDTSTYSTGAGYATATGKMSTIDSVVGVQVEWVFPQDPSLDELVLARYKVYRHKSATAVSNMAIGILMDADVIPASYLGQIQSGVENKPGSDGTRNLVWAGGADTANHVIVGLNTATRFRGGVAVPGGFEGARVGNNGADIQPGGGPTDGFLYSNLQNLAGIDLFSASDTDLYIMVSLDKGRSIGAGETLSYVLVYASDTIDEASFKAKVDAGAALAATVFPSGCTCPCWADPLCDGIRSNVQDVVATVNVAFRNVAAVTDPGCPKQRTDVNADGVTSVVDVVKVVNVAFRNASVATEFVNPCAP